MEFLVKHKIVIFRTLGASMLLVGFALYFWTAPTAVMTQNERAAANVARMEAKVAGGSSSTKSKVKKDDSKYLKNLKETQAKQLRYLTILAMLLGVGFFGFSFMRSKSDSEL